MSGEGEGRAPVVITRPNSKVTSGEAVTQKLVGAAYAFGNILRGTYGPNGLDKMMYKTNGETAVTNDGARIVADLLVKHPAAKAFVSLAESQEEACGDGVTGCILLAAELMNESGRLLERRIHSLRIVEGIQKAREIALDVLDEVSMIASETQLLKVARTSLTGKSSEGASQQLSELVTNAISIIKEENHADYTRVRMAKNPGGDVTSSHLVSGLVLDERSQLDRMTKSFTDGKMLVLSCPLEIESTEREMEIEVSDAQAYQKFIDAEDEILRKKAEAIIKSGTSAVFCAQGIDRRVLHHLVDEGLFVISGIEKSTAEDVALCTGARLIDHLDELSDDDLGTFSKLNRSDLEGKEGLQERVTITSTNPGLVTICVGGGDGTASEEIIRALHDALRSLSTVIVDRRVVVGGGSYYVEAALKIKSAAEKESGKQRLAMEAFSRAMEALPKALASNAGSDSLDTILELRAMHMEGKTTAGVDSNGQCSQEVDALVPSATISHAIEAAVDTACGLLRIDQVISARGD